MFQTLRDAREGCSKIVILKILEIKGRNLDRRIFEME